MKKIIVLSIGLILLMGSIYLFIDKKRQERGFSGFEKRLIGLWEIVPFTAAGYSNVYQFFPNGDFIFDYPQLDPMDEVHGKHLLAFSGTWELHGNAIYLTVNKEKYLEKDKMKFRDVKPIRKMKFVISPIKDKDENGEDFNKLDNLLIGEDRYWKKSDDPNSYL